MKRFWCILALVVLAACAPREAMREATPQTAVISPNFGDHDPHPEINTRRYPVHGVDVSRYQQGVDWVAARAAGVNFAFVKATEGGDGFDPLFPSHWTKTRAAGIRRGAYHMFYHCRPAREQARWFITHVPRDPEALPPVLDMEWTPTSPTCRIRRPAAELRAEARVFLAALAAHYGVRPILYTAPDFYDDNELWRLEGVDFWLRSVAAPVGELYPGQPWLFWQYSGTGRVPGFDGKVDLNVFAGSAQQWAAYATLSK